MLRYSVDEVNSDRVTGWVFDPDGAPSVTVTVDGVELGAAHQGAYRVDVANAVGDQRAVHSGFEFRFGREAFQHVTGTRAQVTVAVGDQQAAAVEVPVLLDAADLPRRGPLPPAVLELLARFDRRYAIDEPWSDDLAYAAVADLRFLVERGPRRTRGLHRHLSLIAQLWVRAAFIEEYFPRENDDASIDDKDRSAVQNSGLEVFAIATHLATLHAHGVAGVFAEFGCFKGFSTAVLSDACHQLGVPMHVFDSFQGLPPTDSEYYAAGDFAGSRAEVESNLVEFGRLAPVTFHEGFFSDSLGDFTEPRIMTMWMDVDLESSAKDVLTILPRLDQRGVLFSHECPGELFAGRLREVVASPDQVIPPIVAAFESVGRTLCGRHIAGNTGAFWDADEGIAPLPTGALLQLRDLALAVVSPPANQEGATGAHTAAPVAADGGIRSRVGKLVQRTPR